MKVKWAVVFFLVVAMGVVPCGCSKSKSSKSDDSVDVSEKSAGFVDSSSEGSTDTSRKLPDFVKPGTDDTGETPEDPPTKCNLAELEAENTSEATVSSAYCLALERPPEKEGFRHWSQKLRNDEINRVDVIYSVIQSEEFKKHVQEAGDNASDFVKWVFRRLLQRDPDETALMFYVDRIESNTWNKDIVVRTIVDSSEFSEKHPIFCNLLALSQMGNHEADVRYAYCLFLGRSPEDSGLQHWLEKLASDEIHQQDLVGAMVGSDEFKKTMVNRNESHIEFVTRLYRRLLRREADKTGMENWIQELSSERLTKKGVVDGFVASEEFKNKHPVFFRSD